MQGPNANVLRQWNIGLKDLHKDKIVVQVNKLFYIRI